MYRSTLAALLIVAAAQSPAAAEPAGGVTGVPDAGAPRATLEAVLPGNQQALLRDKATGDYQLVRIGESFLGYRISAVQADLVVLTSATGTNFVVALNAPATAAAPPAEAPVQAAIPPPAPVAPAPAAPAPVAPAPVVMPAPAAVPAGPAPTAPVPAAVPVPQPAPQPAPAPTVLPVTAAPPAGDPAPDPYDDGTDLLPNPYSDDDPDASYPYGDESPLAPDPYPELAPTAPGPVPDAVPAPPAPPARAPFRSETVILARNDFHAALSDFPSRSREIRVAVEPGRGIRLSDVARGSIFDRLGLRPGDLIRTVAGTRVASIDDAAPVYARVLAADSFVVEVERAGSLIELRVQLTRPTR